MEKTSKSKVTIRYTILFTSITVACILDLIFTHNITLYFLLPSVCFSTIMSIHHWIDLVKEEEYIVDLDFLKKLKEQGYKIENSYNENHTLRIIRAYQIDYATNKKEYYDFTITKMKNYEGVGPFGKVTQNCYNKQLQSGKKVFKTSTLEIMGVYSENQALIGSYTYSKI